MGFETGKSISSRWVKKDFKQIQTYFSADKMQLKFSEAQVRKPRLTFCYHLDSYVL